MKPSGSKKYIKNKKNDNSNVGGKRKKTRKIHKTQKKYDGDKIIPLRCSPKPKDKINGFSCYSNDDLYKLRDKWNARHPDVLIRESEPKQIWLRLKEHMKSVCNKESCWLKQGFVNKETLKKLSDSFAPEAPKKWKKNPKEWLTSVDILNVMKQYEKTYKCFEFMGPSPIDYDANMSDGVKVWPELANFNLEEQIKRGKTKIGIIFNTDPHFRGGEHWISCFLNIKKKTFFFFDSAGNTAPKEVRRFADTIIEQGKRLGINITYNENYPVEHQYENTECGIYSIFFIAHMVEDKLTAEYLKTHVLKDKYMHTFRKVYFNDEL